MSASPIDFRKEDAEKGSDVRADFYDEEDTAYVVDRDAEKRYVHWASSVEQSFTARQARAPYRHAYCAHLHVDLPPLLSRPLQYRASYFPIPFL
jgi:hypothetical protein